MLHYHNFLKGIRTLLFLLAFSPLRNFDFLLLLTRRLDNNDHDSSGGAGLRVVRVLIHLDLVWESRVWGDSGRKPVTSGIQPTRGRIFPAAQKTYLTNWGMFFPNPIHPDTREKPSTRPPTGTTPLLTQKVHLAPNTQQAEQAGFTRAKSHKTCQSIFPEN
jgi:hypothetical protein